MLSLMAWGQQRCWLVSPSSTNSAYLHRWGRTVAAPMCWCSSCSFWASCSTSSTALAPWIPCLARYAPSQRFELVRTDRIYAGIEGLGYNDLKLAAVIGSRLCFAAVPGLRFIAFAGGIVLTAPLLFSGRINRKAAVPLGSLSRSAHMPSHATRPVRVFLQRFRSPEDPDQIGTFRVVP